MASAEQLCFDWQKRLALCAIRRRTDEGMRRAVIHVSETERARRLHLPLRT